VFFFLISSESTATAAATASRQAGKHTGGLPLPLGGRVDRHAPPLDAFQRKLRQCRQKVQQFVSAECGLKVGEPRVATEAVTGAAHIEQHIVSPVLLRLFCALRRWLKDLHAECNALAFTVSLLYRAGHNSKHASCDATGHARFHAPKRTRP
jgi:hypothetical protein